ncbi:hypothetical protein BKA70DRAFT_1412266 [Coprinopsis sp. MPI-PUGE-AT-0042]|nr:hypothetical protein BKA70DRAFT_1412266 [Coprinopsis sp. MPI-PUGE-AT-0042]
MGLGSIKQTLSCGTVCDETSHELMRSFAHGACGNHPKFYSDDTQAEESKLSKMPSLVSPVVIVTADPDEEDTPKIVCALDLGLPPPASIDLELEPEEITVEEGTRLEEAKKGLGRDMVCWKIRIQISGEIEGEKVRRRVQVLERVEVEGGMKRLCIERMEQSYKDPVADRLSKRFMMMGITGSLPRAVEILYGWVSVTFYTTEYESSYDLSTNFGCPIFSEGSLGSYHSTLVHHSMVLQESSSADAGQNNTFFGSNKFEVNGGQLTFAQRDVSKYHSDHYYQVNVLVVQFNGSFHYVGSSEINLRIMFRVFKLGVGCYVLVSIWLILCHTWEDVTVSRKPDILPNPDISSLGVAWRTCYTIFFRTSVILLFPQAIKLLL